MRNDKNYYDFHLVYPDVKFLKKTDTEVGRFMETKIDLSTKFVLTEYRNCVIMEIVLLGFGIKFYFVWE
jgi:hypothetical protein